MRWAAVALKKQFHVNRTESKPIIHRRLIWYLTVMLHIPKIRRKDC